MREEMKNRGIDPLVQDLRETLSELQALFDFGKKKYPNRQWNQHKDLEDALAFARSRLGSMERHAQKALKNPNSTDEESGAMHLVAVAWNALVVAEILMAVKENRLNIS